jgi:hypothetical protein
MGLTRPLGAVSAVLRAYEAFRPDRLLSYLMICQFGICPATSHSVFSVAAEFTRRFEIPFALLYARFGFQQGGTIPKLHAPLQIAATARDACLSAYSHLQNLVVHHQVQN